jgi:signal peptidase II
VGNTLHRLPARTGRALTERLSPRAADVRVGSTTDGLTPISVAERRLGATWPQWASLATVAFAALGADQLTKAIVTSRLDLFDEVHVVGPFSIHHVTNSGIAFGFFSSATSLVILLTSLAVAWMLYFFARSGSRHPILPVALGLVMGGSVSNLIDRVRLGHVTDVLDLRYWPAFNLADTFIVVGVAALLLALVVSDRNAAKPRRVREATRS